MTMKYLAGSSAAPTPTMNWVSWCCALYEVGYRITFDRSAFSVPKVL